MEDLKPRFLKSILKSLKSNKIMTLYALISNAKPYMYYDCDHRK